MNHVTMTDGRVFLQVNARKSSVDIIHIGLLDRHDTRYRLSPSMQIAAEINLGTRTGMEYLLSPVRKTIHEAGRER